LTGSTETLRYEKIQAARDLNLKVDNILVSSSGDVKLADFGTAVQLSKERLQRTTLCGTSYYMVPLSRVFEMTLSRLLS
jgi:hypothetical protein